MPRSSEVDKFYLDLGEAIKNQRIHKGYSQEDLAKYLTLTRTSIVNIEKGRQRPPIHTLYDLASFLNIPITDLFPTEDEKKQTNFIKELNQDLTMAGKKFKDIPVNKNKNKISHFFQLSDPK
jgi:transcriptional regulator with XRE-family HTH domain